MRAVVLAPFIDAICRQRKEDMGESRNPLERQKYEDFDAFPDDIAETLEFTEDLVLSRNG